MNQYMLAFKLILDKFVIIKSIIIKNVNELRNCIKMNTINSPFMSRGQTFYPVKATGKRADISYYPILVT